MPADRADDVKDTIPLTSGRAEAKVPSMLSVTVTVPVGVPLLPVTVMVKATGLPTSPALGLEATWTT